MEAESSDENAESLQRLKLNGASVDDYLFIALSIFSEKALEAFQKEEVQNFVFHPEIKALYSELSDIYGQNPGDFARLSHLVIERVDNPEKILNLVNFSSGFEGQKEEMPMVFDCIFRTSKTDSWPVSPRN